METASRIQASEWDVLSEWASSGNCVPRRRGGDSHGGTWGIVVLRGAGPSLPKIHLVNQMLADRIKSTAAQIVKSWAAPLLGQEVSALMAATCYASNAA